MSCPTPQPQPPGSRRRRDETWKDEMDRNFSLELSVFSSQEANAVFPLSILTGHCAI